MKKDLLHENFLRAIHTKIPHHSTLTNTLVEMLHIEKEAVYRRLRSEVPFTLAEAATVSSRFGISLDYLVGLRTETSKPFQLALMEYENPLDEDFSMLGNLIRFFRRLRTETDEKPEAGLASNVIPQSLCMNYRFLADFYLFKWLYLYESPGEVKSFRAVKAGEKLRKLHRDFIFEARRLGSTSYIIDHQAVQYLVCDIRYFAGIRLITEEEVSNLKTDIHRMLDDFETLAAKGGYDSGSKVGIYISNINFDTSYSYIETANHKISLIPAFTLNSLFSLDGKTFERVKKWIQSLKRLSTLISESGEIQRVLFFEKQREIVDSL